MTYLQPFFLLLGRASVFWVGLVTFLCLAFLTLAVSQPDELPAAYVDVAFLIAFAFPAAAGWLAGAVLQEFQETTFAWALPAVRRRLALGFLTTGAGVSLLASVLASPQREEALSVPLLFTVGLAGYGLGGVLIDPLRRWLHGVHLLVLLAVAARSRTLAEAAAAHPLITALLALALAALGFGRRFSVAAFRYRPFHPSSQFPGAYSLQRSASYDRQRTPGPARAAALPPRRYLGAGAWRWALASAYETYGPIRPRSLVKVLDRLWILALLFALLAWSDRGELSFWESLGRTVHEALLYSPHVPRFGDGSGGPHPLVSMVVAAVGAVLALWTPSSLQTSAAYPLSRARRAAVVFRGALLDAGVFVATVGAVLAIAGLGAGVLVGYPVRLDYVPLFFRALAATLLFMPLARWARLHLEIATLRKTANTLVPVALGVFGMVCAVSVWVHQTTRLGASPAVELAWLAALLALSWTLLWTAVRRFYATHDLC